MPKKETGGNITVLSFFPSPSSLAPYREGSWGKVDALAVENLSLQFPCSLQRYQNGQSGETGGHAPGVPGQRTHVELGEKGCFSTCFGTYLESNEAYSVTGLKGQRQIRLVPTLTEHVGGRDGLCLKWEGIEEEVAFGPWMNQVRTRGIQSQFVPAHKSQLLHFQESYTPVPRHSHY